MEEEEEEEEEEDADLGSCLTNQLSHISNVDKDVSSGKFP